MTSALLGKLTLAERYDEGTLADDLAEVEILVSHLPPPDLADALEALPYDARTALWCLVPDDKRGEVLLEALRKCLGRPDRQDERPRAAAGDAAAGYR
ncbi:hypothetical protein LNP26_19045 [Klebsiella variicola subsp. variicola]|nr:hypothetical protein [Klebsiella variicola subsp. variicola]